VKLDGIEYYIFDLDDTLYEEMQFVRAGMKAVCEYIAKKHGLNADAVYDTCMHILEIEGRGKVFDELCSKYKITEDIGQLVQVYRTPSQSMELYGDAKELIKEIKKHNFKIGIITDGNYTAQSSKVKMLDLEDQMDAIVYSDLLKDEKGESRNKPDLEVYRECIRRLDGACDKAVYIGDNPRKDFIGAKKLGMKTVRISRDKGMFMGEVPDEEHEADLIIKSLEELI
jgi:putative hydrolase of the HAD superfamily